jgi:hypothetical protein
MFMFRTAVEKNLRSNMGELEGMLRDKDRQLEDLKVNQQRELEKLNLQQEYERKNWYADFEIEKRKVNLQIEEERNKLRAEMQQALIQSDLTRTEALAQLKMYEKMDTKADANTIKEMVGKLIEAIGKVSVPSQISVVK